MMINRLRNFIKRKRKNAPSSNSGSSEPTKGQTIEGLSELVNEFEWTRMASEFLDASSIKLKPGDQYCSEIFSSGRKLLYTDYVYSTRLKKNTQENYKPRAVNKQNAAIIALMWKTCSSPLPNEGKFLVSTDKKLINLAMCPFGDAWYPLTAVPYEDE